MPDLNVWLALSWTRHIHSDAAWQWYSRQKAGRFLFCRITQLGLLRLLSTSSVMAEDVQTINQAWTVYDRWLGDPGVGFWQETFQLEPAFRASTKPFLKMSSPKVLGDCYLLAASQTARATLVTFDRALASACKKAEQSVTLIE